jgi:hypothetical protein
MLILSFVIPAVMLFVVGMNFILFLKRNVLHSSDAWTYFVATIMCLSPPKYPDFCAEHHIDIAIKTGKYQNCC